MNGRDVMKVVGCSEDCNVRLLETESGIIVGHNQSVKAFLGRDGSWVIPVVQWLAGFHR